MANASKNKPTYKTILIKKVTQLTRSPYKMISLVVVVVLIGGTGTAVAASGSKPGDALYGVKRATEAVRLAFSFNDSLKESTHQELAKERFREIQALFKEPQINSSGVAGALTDFEQQRQEAASLASKTGDTHANQVKDELSSYESQINKLFESRQLTLEGQQESLKRQYSQAIKIGNAPLATQLNSQIGTFESQLKDLQVKRETSKQEQETLTQTIETHDSSPTIATDEAVKERQEALSEAVKAEVEAQNEAAKQAAEKQAEDAQKAKDQQDENAKKAQEQQQESSQKTGSD